MSAGPVVSTPDNPDWWNAVILAGRASQLARPMSTLPRLEEFLRRRKCAARNVTILDLDAEGTGRLELMERRAKRLLCSVHI